MTMTMMTVNEELHVGISEYKIAQAPTRLITVGLGSCIGTIIYDEASHIGGLSHIMLPDRSRSHTLPTVWGRCSNMLNVDTSTNSGSVGVVAAIAQPVGFAAASSSLRNQTESKKPLEPNDSKGFAVPPQGFEPWTR